LMFFIQFVSIMLDNNPGPAAVADPGQDRPLDGAGDDKNEIAGRLVEFMGLSLLVGLGGGILISRVITRPVSDLTRAARKIGKGDLSLRVRPHGSAELVELAETFNGMAADLEHAETLRSNLMADVSHELRTPLTVLEGNLRAVLDHVYAMDEAEIANLYSQTHHLIRLVNDLRELSLAESHQLPMEKQPTDLAALLADTLQTMEPLAQEKGVRLTNQAANQLTANIDPFRIRQVLFNLLSNALRHTPEGGEIVVNGTASSSVVRLSVQDSGDGLDPEQIAVVFDRFYRGDRSRSRETGGTGLGLAIVKAIVEAHGGRVEASSAGKGTGSTFTIVLPLD
ncbi:MAG: HAMP domain-containing protein, partial [Anaerolineaceae bacterium]|nr:HAMP domain-containing protein [Anaerolineaceae bacterium]